ncbi:hypothetical protein [Microbacterium sp. 13-71-7]|uniref:hypothetical protein n=1 Tax=Microbacterium sp. 13-71-7 TaxID=1970399 RepID=UPI002601431D|nr:hypothetical protein [Microbacterium sp. 13-71-7]
MTTQRGVLLLAGVLGIVALSGCGATGSPDADPTQVPPQVPTASPTAADPAREEAAQRADRWLSTAAVPPGAVQVKGPTTSFNSSQGWVCEPTITKQRFWTVEGMSFTDVANWMMANPTPGLISNRTGPLDPDSPADEVNIGNVPHRGALEGVVFTVAKVSDGTVAIHAEIGAAATDAVCPTPPGGGSWGEPGMG